MISNDLVNRQEEYITIPKREYDRLKALEEPNPCEHCEYYNKPLWVIPEAHPCKNCHKKNKKVFIPIITCRSGDIND